MKILIAYDNRAVAARAHCSVEVIHPPHRP